MPLLWSFVADEKSKEPSIMATATAERLMTADDLERLPNDDRVLYELDEGRLICLSPAASLSTIVATNVTIEMGMYVKQHGLGICFGSEGGFRLASNPDTVRAPDVSFVQKERIPQEGIPRRGFWQGAPDLAVEVLSPSNRPGEMWRRIGDLLNAGTRLIWVIDPERRTALIIHPGGETQLHGEEYTLDGENVIPGFLLPLRDVLA
jgi:Uma2 family endonuclease